MEKNEGTKSTSSRELASRIYVELVVRNTQVEQGSVKMTASPANLATLSMKLAEAFVQAEDEAIAAKAPVNVKDYNVGSNIAEWMKK